MQLLQWQGWANCQCLRFSSDVSRKPWFIHILCQNTSLPRRPPVGSPPPHLRHSLCGFCTLKVLSHHSLFLILVDSGPPFFLFFPLLVFWVHPLDSILIWCLFLSFILYFSSPELDWSVRKWMFSNKKSLKCKFCSFPFFPSFFGVCHSYSVYLLFISLIPLMNFCTLQPQMVKQEAPGGRGLA